MPRSNFVNGFVRHAFLKLGDLAVAGWFHALIGIYGNMNFGGCPCRQVHVQAQSMIPGFPPRAMYGTVRGLPSTARLIKLRKNRGSNLDALIANRTRRLANSRETADQPRIHLPKEMMILRTLTAESFRQG